MELEHEELQGVLDTVPRDVLVYWLQWNDPNGIYSDQDCKDEGISPLNLEQAKTYVYHVIMRDDPNWDGRMGNRYIEDFSFLE